jgi:hypothetical protein
MNTNATQIVQNLLGFSILKDKNSIISVLKRNGIQIPPKATDNQIIKATLLSSSRSSNFKSDLSKILQKNAKKIASSYKGFVGDSNDFGFTGIDDFSFTGYDDFVNAPGDAAAKREAKRQARVSATNPQGKTQAGLFFNNLAKGLISEDTINSGINIGLTAINNKMAGKQNALQNEATVITQRQDEVRQTLSQPTKGSKTLTYVFVGVGILAIIGVVYFVAKKKK